MRNGTGSRYKSLRKRVRPLRPWIVGLNVPDVVSELADVKPFIYLCCKLSVTEQSWANMPENPKALIVKDKDSLRLCDGQFWIYLNVDGSQQQSLVCRNKFRNRDVCFFIVFLNEYLINYDSASQNFIANANDLKIVKETHCLSEAFSSIPSIKIAEEDLLTVIVSPLFEDIESTKSRSSTEDSENGSIIRKSGSEVLILDIEPPPVSVTVEGFQLSETATRGEVSESDSEKANDGPPPSVEQNNVLPPELSSCVDKWIPTQNPGCETLSFGAVSAEDESNNTATPGRVLRTPQKTTNSHSVDEGDPIVDLDLFHISDLTPPNSVKRKLRTSSHSADLDRTRKLQNDFLTWLSTQEPTVEICFLEETAHAIEELREIEPAKPFSNYFNNFAFIE